MSNRYREPAPSNERYPELVAAKLSTEQREAVEYLAEAERKSVSWWLRDTVQAELERRAEAVAVA